MLLNQHHLKLSGRPLGLKVSLQKSPQKTRPSVKTNLYPLVLIQGPLTSDEQNGNSCDESKNTTKQSAVHIPRAKKTEDNARLYDKKQSCFYCSKMYPKIARHYATVHQKEMEVAKALAFPTSSKGRKKQLEKLRLMGNYHHNIRVLETRAGELIVQRRPSQEESITPEDFLPCPHCLAFIRRGELWRHNKTCQFKSNDESNDENEDKKWGSIQESSKMILMSNLKPHESPLLQKVLSSMKSDEPSLVARNDDVICKYGAIQAERLGPDHIHIISQGMRQLARLLIQLRQNTSMGTHFKDFLKPEHFDHIVTSVKTLCSFDSSTTCAVGIPSLALKLGHAIKKCITIQRGKALREKDQLLLTDQENLQKLMEAEWSDKISSHSLTTLHQRKFNKVNLLPLTEDLEQLRKHLLERIAMLTASVRKNPTLDNWGQLAEVTLARVIIFNKRRGGEASKMSLEAFNNRPDWGENSSSGLKDCLEPVERELCKRLDMVEIRGKRGRKVPVLITPEMKTAMQVLADNRKKVNINPANVFFFARPNESSVTHLRGWDCLNKLTKTTGLKLKQPESITSNRLRKYVATVSQVLDLQDKELDWLARHMGHDIRIHREYYRLHESTLELAKVSKILSVVDEGNYAKYIGKPLNEIEVELPEEECSDDENDEEDQTHQTSSSQDVAAINRAKPHQAKKRQELLPDFEDDTRPTTDEDKMTDEAERRKETGELRKTEERKKAERRRKETEGRRKAEGGRKEAEGSQPKRKKLKHTLWTSKEKEAVFSHLSRFIQKKTLPGKLHCTQCIEKSKPVLDGRDWSSVKYFIKNVIARSERLKQKGH